ncbi:MAG TPA: hypothetical protein VFU93_10595 [Acidimicrobiales bacterium]|nr:hypothetical protein [Acidimicrobiales bacterium]
MSDAKSVVEEFGGNRVAMAAEILRLRAALADVSFDLSRAAAAGVSGILLDAAPPTKAPRPVGFQPR